MFLRNQAVKFTAYRLSFIFRRNIIQRKSFSQKVDCGNLTLLREHVHDRKKIHRKMFLWACRKQFWQPCRKFLLQVLKKLQIFVFFQKYVSANFSSENQFRNTRFCLKLYCGKSGSACTLGCLYFSWSFQQFHFWAISNPPLTENTAAMLCTSALRKMAWLTRCLRLSNKVQYDSQSDEKLETAKRGNLTSRLLCGPKFSTLCMFDAMRSLAEFVWLFFCLLPWNFCVKFCLPLWIVTPDA